MNDLLVLRSVDDAQHDILGLIAPVPSEVIPLGDALDRVIACRIVASIDVPPFANSAMDGFAVRSADTQSTGDRVQLDVIGSIRAGSPEQIRVGAGQAVRIMTGAPIPDGADAVVPFEDTSMPPGSEPQPFVIVPAHTRAGAAVRPAGLDIRSGDKCLDPGTVLGPAQLALCATIGISQIEVYRRPIVAILATGDELVEAGQPLKPGQIYNSNGVGLAAAVRKLGAVPMLLPHAADTITSLRALLKSASEADLVITSGGVSVGDHDHLKEAVAQVGSVDFWRVRMRPGKPLMIGRLELAHRTIPILGLPGNPVSTLVTFFVFAAPAIRGLLGIQPRLPASESAIAAEDFDNRGGRETFFRVVVEPGTDSLTVRLAGGQDSSMLLPLARADGLARVPAEVERLRAGESVRYYKLP